MGSTVMWWARICWGRGGREVWMRLHRGLWGMYNVWKVEVDGIGFR